MVASNFHGGFLEQIFRTMMLKNIPCRKAQEEACKLRMLWHLGVHMFPKIHWEKCFQDFVRICGLDKDHTTFVRVINVGVGFVYLITVNVQPTGSHKRLLFLNLDLVDGHRTIWIMLPPVSLSYANPEDVWSIGKGKTCQVMAILDEEGFKGLCTASKRSEKICQVCWDLLSGRFLTQIPQKKSINFNLKFSCLIHLEWSSIHW